eukprot:8932555-Alexandrium_andersonii.AAC.1
MLAMGRTKSLHAALLSKRRLSYDLNWLPLGGPALVRHLCGSCDHIADVHALDSQPPRPNGFRQ